MDNVIKILPTVDAKANPLKVLSYKRTEKLSDGVRPSFAHYSQSQEGHRSRAVGFCRDKNRAGQ